jgi:hypothetical protein
MIGVRSKHGVIVEGNLEHGSTTDRRDIGDTAWSPVATEHEIANAEITHKTPSIGRRDFR